MMKLIYNKLTLSIFPEMEPQAPNYSLEKPVH